MKSILKYALLLIMFVCALLIVMDIQSIDTRKSELQTAIHTSMRDVLKATSIHKLYPMKQEDMSVELIRNIADNINTDSDLRIDILGLDTQGLLNVQATSTFTHLNGEKDARTIQKTMITEEYENEPSAAQ